MFNPPLGGYQGRPVYGCRVSFLLISPYAKKNYSFDVFAGSIRNMFDHKRKTRFILDPKIGDVR